MTTAPKAVATDDFLICFIVIPSIRLDIFDAQYVLCNVKDPVRSKDISKKLTFFKSE